MNWFPRLRAALLFVATCLGCVALHEAGHALAGVLTGGKVTRFVVVSARPHVRIQGSSTKAQDALKAAAGSACFVAVWLLGMALVRPSPASKVAAASALVAFVEGCGWLISSLIYPWGPHDDAWRFLAHSGANSWAVAAGAALVVLAGGSAFLTRMRPPLAAQPAARAKAAGA
jgi:hypothetical protein